MEDEFQAFDPVGIKGAKNEFALCFCVRQTGGLKDPKGWLDSIRIIADACSTLDETQFQNLVARSIKDHSSIFKF